MRGEFSGILSLKSGSGGERFFVDEGTKEECGGVEGRGEGEDEACDEEERDVRSEFSESRIRFIRWEGFRGEERPAERGSISSSEEERSMTECAPNEMKAAQLSPPIKSESDACSL